MARCCQMRMVDTVRIVRNNVAVHLNVSFPILTLRGSTMSSRKSRGQVRCCGCSAPHWVDGNVENKLLENRKWGWGVGEGEAGKSNNF